MANVAMALTGFFVILFGIGCLGELGRHHPALAGGIFFFGGALVVGIMHLLWGSGGSRSFNVIDNDTLHHIQINETTPKK